MTEQTVRRTRVVRGKPSAAATFPKAALGSLLPGALHHRSSALPDVELVREDVTVGADELSRYAEVCGFGLGADLPGTFPHVLGFPLHMSLMTGWSFPVPTLGLVHTRNVITQHRAIGTGEALTVRAHAEGLRRHPRGSELDIVTTVAAAGEEVWVERCTLLARGAKLGEERPAPPRTDDAPVVEEAAGPNARWRVGADTGRRYAAVSSDYNPIHLHPLTSRLFGFPRPIAHGMWTAARVLAALEGRLPSSYTYDVRFRQPLATPATVAYRVRPGAGAYAGWTVTVTDAKSEQLHLAATLRVVEQQTP